MTLTRVDNMIIDLKLGKDKRKIKSLPIRILCCAFA